jgi:hypothetical protein
MSVYIDDMGAGDSNKFYRFREAIGRLEKARK